MTDAVIRGMVREVISTNCKEELFLVDSYAPGKMKHGTTAGGPMGLGVDIPGSMAIVVLWKIFDELLKEVCKEVAKGWIASIKKLLKARSISTAERQDETRVAQQGLAAYLVAEGIEPGRAEQIANTMLIVFLANQRS